VSGEGRHSPASGDEPTHRARAAGGRGSVGRGLGLGLGLGLVLTLGLGLGLAACGPDAEPQPGGSSGREVSSPAAGANLVIISLDTLRSDAISPYGGPKAISPVLQAFADEAVLFSHARAAAPQTAPSHMSLFTSVYPSAHNVQNVQHGTDPVTGRKGPLIQPLPPSIPTLAEILKAAGYRTVGLTDGGNLNAAHGFPRGFDHYSLDLSGAWAQVDDGKTWLKDLTAGDQPWFMFWHTYEIHAPYFAPAEYVDRWAPKEYDGLLAGVLERFEGLDFKQRFAAMRSVFWKDKADFGWLESAYLHGLYKAGIEFTDEALGSLLDDMRAQGVFENSIVVITSDHGEEFFEHGQWQHDQLYEECLRVPLMVRLPGGLGGGTRLDTPVSLIDLVPTLLDLMELDPAELTLPGPARFHGASLATSILEGTEPEAKPIYSEYRADRKGGPLYDWQVAIHNQGLKYLVDEVRGGRARLFDLSKDDDEQHDVLGKRPDMAGRFEALHAHYKAELEAWENLARMQGGATLDCDQLRALVELGYLDGSVLSDCD